MKQINSIIIDLKKAQNWILVIGVLLCGTYLSKPAFDQALTSRYIIWCGFAMLLLVCLFLRKPNIHFSSISVALILLLIAECLSGLFAVNQSEWLYHVLRTFLMVFTVFYIAESNKKYLIRTIIVLGAVYFCIAQYEFISTSYVDSKGIFCNRNSWAIAHFLVIPFCFMEKKWKWFARIVAIGMTVNLFLLMTRSVLLGLGVFWFVVFVLEKRLRKYLILVFVPAVLAVIFFRWDRLINLESLSQRKEIWTATMRMFIDNPCGIGTGNWWLAIFPYLKDVNLPNAFSSGVLRHPHNDFFWIGAESGYLGLTAYLGLFYFAIRRAIKNRNTWVASGLFGCMAIAFFSSFLRERAFLSFLLCVLIAFTLKNQGITFVSSRALFVTCFIILSLFSIDLYYRHRSLCFQTKLLKSNRWEYALTEGGFSIFSTLSFEGIPWHWYRGIAKDRLKQDALNEFEIAYKYSPYNVHVLNGLGTSYGRRGDLISAKECFLSALEIHPDLKKSQMNLKQVTQLEKAFFNIGFHGSNYGN